MITKLFLIIGLLSLPWCAMGQNLIVHYEGTVYESLSLYDIDSLTIDTISYGKIDRIDLRLSKQEECIDSLRNLLLDNSFQMNLKTDTITKRIDNLETKVFNKDFLNSIKNGVSDIKLAEGVYDIDEPIQIPSGTIISGVRGKTIIRVHSMHGFVVDNATDVKLQDLTIIGDAPDTPLKNEMQPVMKANINDYTDALNEVGKGTQVGIILRNSEKVEIYGCEIRNFDAYGIQVVACGTNYRYTIRIGNNWINNCYCGLKTEREAERSQYFANTISLCQIGAYIDSGTNFFSSCAFNANYIGCILGDGKNSAHGHMTDCAFTHCTLHGLVCYNLFAGQIFNGCKLGYVDDNNGVTGNAAVIINSRGVAYSNGYVINGKLKFDGSYAGDASSAHSFNGNMISGFCILDVDKCSLHKSGNYMMDGTDSSKLND